MMVRGFLDDFTAMFHPRAIWNAFRCVPDRLRQQAEWLQSAIGIPFAFVSILTMAAILAWWEVQSDAQFLLMIGMVVIFFTAVLAKVIFLWRERETLQLKLVESGQELSFLVTDVLREAVPGEPEAREEHQRISCGYQKNLVMRFLSEDSRPIHYRNWLLRDYLRGACELSAALSKLQTALHDDSSSKVIEGAEAIDKLVHSYCRSSIRRRRLQPLIAPEASRGIVRAWIELIQKSIDKLNAELEATGRDRPQLPKLTSDVCMATRTVSSESLPFRSMLFAAAAEERKQLTDVLEKAAEAMTQAQQAGVLLAPKFRENIELRQDVLRRVLDSDDDGVYRAMEGKKPGTAAALKCWESRMMLNGSCAEPIEVTAGTR